MIAKVWSWSIAVSESMARRLYPRNSGGKNKAGRTVKQAMDDDPELREGVIAEVREAKVTQTEWLPEHGCKVTLGLQKFEVEKWVGDLQDP